MKKKERERERIRKNNGYNEEVAFNVCINFTLGREMALTCRGKTANEQLREISEENVLWLLRKPAPTYFLFFS